MFKFNTDAFFWYSFDIETQLREIISHEWDQKIIEFAKMEMKKIQLRPNSSTSREQNTDTVINIGLVDGVKIKNRLKWLYTLYKTAFLNLAENATGLSLSCSSNDLHGINLNTQIGASMRYECHVDSNPVQGVLFVTSHTVAQGGALYVANYKGANNIDEVQKDCSIIEPKKGSLIFFDARKFSHFVSPLTSPTSTRVAVAMNYYTSDCSESKRPKELNSHLGLE